MPIPIGCWEPDSPEWLQARRNRVGGSEIGVICGWSPYPDATRQRLLHRKLGLLEEKPTSRAMDRGKRLEAPVIGWLADRHKLAVDMQASSSTYTSPQCDRWLYNPDAIGVTASDTLVLLEAKTTSDRSADHGWGKAGTDKVPLHYAAQCQWGMGVLGIDVCYLGVLNGCLNGRPNLDFATYTLRFDPGVFAYMCGEADDFLAELETLRKEYAA